MTSEYSTTWFSTFMDSIPFSQTEAEAAFIVRHLPQPPYRSVLDLCCGTGRHARLLDGRGYDVTGVDRSTTALAEARHTSQSSITYFQRDMRDLASLDGSFDAVLCLWQSFGYFDASTNRDILRQICNKLHPAGRLILDIYHRSFFEQHQETRNHTVGERTITERKSMDGNRLKVHLSYDTAGEASDTFEWELFTPAEILDLATGYGLEPMVCCTGFNEDIPVSPDHPRMQFVLQAQS